MATAAPEIPALARDRAFESLYRRYVDDVYRYALALLRNPADAEDVTQTTFLNAYRAVQRGQEIEKPQNWLIKIAHNAARSRYARASRRVAEVPLDEHLEQLAVPEVERPQVQDVLDALGRLPLNQRAALVMRELEGRTYAEIADTLGVSVAAVETLIFRARRSLRVNASSIRVLGLVPAPGWLWNLLDGGGVAGGGAAAAGGAAAGSGAAAGGGSIVGYGFLLKAAVAVVAGAVASGINSDRPKLADAARSPLTRVASTAGGSSISSTRIVGAGTQGGGVVAGGASSSASIPRGELGTTSGVPLGEVPHSATASPVVGIGGSNGGGGSIAVVSGSSAAPSRSGGGIAASAVGALSGAAGQVVSTAVGAVASALPLPSLPGVVSVSAPSAPVQVPAVSVPPVHAAVPPVQVPAPPVHVPPAPVKVPAPPPLPVSLP